MKSVVYFIKNGDAIKVGHTSSLDKRVAALSVTSPHGLSVLLTIEGSALHERSVHRDLAAFRLNGEWFKDCQEVRSVMASYAINGIVPVDARSAVRITPDFASSDDSAPDFQINIHRLPMLDAKKEANRHGLAAMEALLAQVEKRASRGLPVDDLIAQADAIMSSVGCAQQQSQ